MLNQAFKLSSNWQFFQSTKCERLKTNFVAFIILELS